MQSKIINVNKCYWAAHIRKEKVDHGYDFNDYCQIPITNTCRVLVLDPTDFTALLYLCFSKPYIGRTPYSGPHCATHRITSRDQRDTTDCADISTLCRPAVRDSWRCTVCCQHHLYQLI